MIADLRRKIQLKESVIPSETSTAERVRKTNTFTFSSPKKTHNQISPLMPQALYALPVADLQKTAVVTSAILIIQVILFFLLKQHLITIPMVSY